MRILLFAISIHVCTCIASQSINYSDPSSVLGLNVRDADFISVLDYWGLDKRYQNPQRGLKFYWNYEIERIVSVLLTADDFELNKVEYKSFNGILPFSVVWSDTETAIKQKAGEPLKTGTDFLKYRKDNKLITFRFRSEARKRLTSIKISVDPRDFKEEELPVPVDTVLVSKEPVKVEPGFEVMFATAPPFRKAIMRILWSATRNAYSAIKQKELSSENFWGYKFTTATNVQVPGERYNLLYNFPFENSQTDWVCVMAESAQYSNIISNKYHEIELLFKEQFTNADGWQTSYEKTSKADELPDLKVQHAQWGTVVLDYSKKPKGGVVLYIRTIPYYN